jgi:hypothetical protein
MYTHLHNKVYFYYKCTHYMTCLRWPCHVSAICYCRDPNSIPGQSAWNFWWTKWHWDRFCHQVLMFSPVSIIPPMLHTHSFVYLRCLNDLRNWQCPAIRYLKAAIDSNYFPTPQSLPGLSNGSELCSLWGTNWIFLYRIMLSWVI